MTAESLAGALVAAQAEFGSINRSHKATVPTKSGGSYSYSYADLADVMAMIRPVLAAHGLGVVQDVTTLDGAVAVTTRLVHVSGETMLFGPVCMNRGGTAQELGSAITYARRYGLTAALGIVTDDDDGQAATAGAPRKAPAKTTRPRATEPEPPTSPAEGDVSASLAGERQALARAMNNIADEAYKHATKAGFVERFGKPAELPLERVRDAWAWVEEALQQEPRT